MLLHWDEAKRERVEHGPLVATWTNLGVHSKLVGLKRLEIDPGKRPTPPHAHGAEEEIFYVLGGSGLSWQDGETYEVRSGDCLVHRASWEAHTLLAGDGGLDVLAFGQRKWVELGWLPRAGVGWLGNTWVEGGREPEPWDRELEAAELEFPPPSPRPERIVNVDEAGAVEWTRPGHVLAYRDLGAAAGSRWTGLKHVALEPGQMGPPPHCHSAEEELFVVLDGEGTLLLGDDEHPVRRGSVVARPAGTRLAHAFRSGEGGLVYLAYGTRDPNDIAYYPRSGKVLLRGVGVIGRLEQLDYWEGEE
jgi:uncharacterized cupin superfamily protein